MFYKPSSGGCKQTWVNYCVTGMIIPMNTPTPDPNDPEYPLVNKHSYGKWPIVDFPIENGDLNHSYVTNYQRVTISLFFCRVSKIGNVYHLVSSNMLNYQRINDVWSSSSFLSTSPRMARTVFRMPTSWLYPWALAARFGVCKGDRQTWA